MTKMSSYEREMEQGDRFRNEKGWGEQKTENRDRTEHMVMTSTHLQKKFRLSEKKQNDIHSHYRLCCLSFRLSFHLHTFNLK